VGSIIRSLRTRERKGSRDEPVKILLVGLGRWGEQHLRVLSEFGVEVWVSDLAAERRQRAVKTVGLDPRRAVADFRSALDHVDAVDLVTPADTHLALATECLRAGKDCFVEKPMTRTVEEAIRLAKTVALTGRILQVGYIFRFHPVSDALKRLIAEGRIGKVRYLAGRFAGFKRPRTDVGVTQTDAIHYFDLFADLLDCAPSAVTATLRDYLGRGMDDLSFTTVEYGEIPAFVEAGYFVPGTYRSCLVVGERGSLVADFSRSTVGVFEGHHEWVDGRWMPRERAVETVAVSGEEPLRRELGAFLDAVRHGHPPAVDVEAGLWALRAVEAALRSSRTGRRVRVDVGLPA
jgi:predicted dehydrogenase